MLAGIDDKEMGMRFMMVVIRKADAASGAEAVARMMEYNMRRLKAGGDWLPHFVISVEALWPEFRLQWTLR